MGKGKKWEHWKEDLILGTTNMIYKKQRDKPDYGFLKLQKFSMTRMADSRAHQTFHIYLLQMDRPM